MGWNWEWSYADPMANGEARQGGHVAEAASLHSAGFDAFVFWSNRIEHHQRFEPMPGEHTST